MTTPAPTEFRWWFADDALGGQWSRWHALHGPCTACCHGDGPDPDGEHREPAERYDTDGYLDASGHAYCDPGDWPGDIERR